MTRVLGVDPGTVQMGIGVLDTNGSRCELVAYDTVKISKNLAPSKKIRVIYEAVRGFIQRYQPNVMALENVFFGENVHSLVRIGEARASAMLAAEECGVPVVEYPPARVKQAVSGSGRASKIQVQQMVKHRLRLKELPPTDAADALAVALCHFQSHNVRIPVR